LDNIGVRWLLWAFGKFGGFSKLALRIPSIPNQPLEFSRRFLNLGITLKVLGGQKEPNFDYMSTCHFVEVPVTFVDAMLYLHQKRVNLVDMWSI